MLAITFLVEWVKLRSSSLINKKEWVDLFFSFIGFLNTGSTEEQVRFPPHCNLKIDPLGVTWPIIEALVGLCREATGTRKEDGN